MKVGFVVTAHWSDEYRPDGQFFLTRFCDSVFNFCKYNFNIYVVDNGSSHKLNILDHEAIKVIRIEDQTIEGIIGAWNKGLNYAYIDDCDIIINCNDDLWFNDTINELINYIICNPDINALYSGLTNGVLGGSQLANGPRAGIQIKKGHDPLNGFCFAMLRSHYEKFRFKNDKYFNKDNKYNAGETKWAGQEGQFIQHSEELGLYGIVVESCFISHTKVRGWTKLRGKFQ